MTIEPGNIVTMKPWKIAVRYSTRKETAIAFGIRNLRRWDYATNTIQSSCKVIFTARFKRSTMHWSVTGANKILAIRCCKRSGRFEDVFERRSKRKVAA